MTTIMFNVNINYKCHRMVKYIYDKIVGLKWLDQTHFRGRFFRKRAICTLLFIRFVRMRVIDKVMAPKRRMTDGAWVAKCRPTVRSSSPLIRWLTTRALVTKMIINGVIT